MSEVLRQGETHGRVRPLELSIVKKVGSAVGRTSDNLGLVVNSVVP